MGGYAYSPYGESQTIGPDVTSNPVQYTSRESDGTGLMYYRARYYDAVLKRFVSSDPIGLAGGANTFAYVEGNPLGYVDPLGLWTVEIGGYLGGGGSLTFGRDPASGGGFMAFKLGKGLGFGAAYNPQGERAGGAASQCKHGGAGVGVFAEAGANLGPASGMIGASWGRNFMSWFSSSAGYGGIEPSGSIDTKWGIGLGAAAGIELTVFGSGNNCTCSSSPNANQGAPHVDSPGGLPMRQWTQADFLYGYRP